MPSVISAGTTAGTAIAITGDTTGNLAFQTNGTTTAVTIDTSQNVGIGTTSPARKLEVNGVSSSGTNMQITSTSGGAGIKMVPPSGSTWEIQAQTTDFFSAYNRTLDSYGLRIDSSSNLLFNSGYGSAAVAYGCRAWVNFNGTGTVAIRASGNVTSITDNGVGQYTVNLTNSMPDANYSVGVNTDYDGVGAAVNAKNFATGSFSVQCILPNLSNYTDHSLVNCQVFR
jgi:hypothetical protein